MSDFNRNGIVLSLGYSANVKRGQVVKFDAADRMRVRVADTAGDRPLGVYSSELNDDAERPNTEQALAVTASGLAKSFAGADIAAGEELVAVTSGLYAGYVAPLSSLGLAAGAGAYVVGTALESATVKQQVEILLKPYFHTIGS